MLKHKLLNAITFDFCVVKYSKGPIPTNSFSGNTYSAPWNLHIVHCVLSTLYYHKEDMVDSDFDNLTLRALTLENDSHFVSLQIDN